jgi:hypothetical protein
MSFQTVALLVSLFGAGSSGQSATNLKHAQMGIEWSSPDTFRVVAECSRPVTWEIPKIGILRCRSRDCSWDSVRGMKKLNNVNPAKESRIAGDKRRMR